MATHHLHPKGSEIYFITFTCLKWIPLFEIANAYDSVYNWFNYLKDIQKCQVFGYVIMPNHVHVIIKTSDESKSINMLVGNGKRFIAYDIVNKLKASGNKELLNTLSNAVQYNEKKKGKKHHIFRLSFDCKVLESKKNIISVLDYIHHNPVMGKWNLVEAFVNFQHSSATFYEENESGVFDVDHFAAVYDDSKG